MKIIFICYGNICRSPMAEYMFKEFCKKSGYKAIITSKATSDEEIGSPVYYGTARILDRLGIDYSMHHASRLTLADCDEADYLIGMEESNLRAIRRIAGERNFHKIYKVLDFTDSPCDIPDPWYTRDFEATYRDLDKGLKAFLEFIKAEGRCDKEKK